MGPFATDRSRSVAGYNESACGGVQIGKGSGLKRRRPQGLVGSSPTRRTTAASIVKPTWKVERAIQLSEAGWNNCQISRELGVHRQTVSDWVRRRSRVGPCPGYSRNPSCPRCPGQRETFRGLTAFAYAYLLGLYLGDGWIASHRRGVYRLRIFLDRGYPQIVAECEAAVSIVMPDSKAAVYRRKHENLDEVGSYSKHWLHLFPQHGPGRKLSAGSPSSPGRNESPRCTLADFCAG